MTVTEEGGGRLNAFAQEPRMEVIPQNTGYNRSSILILITGLIVLISLIAYTLTLS